MLYLFLATFFWGSTFLVQRTAAMIIDPFLFNGVRFAAAGLILIFACTIFKVKNNKLTFIKACACGILVSIAINLQQIGIESTTAGKAGIITSLYLLFIPILLLFNKRIIEVFEIAALLTSLVGFYLLSGVSEFKAETGDLIVLASSFIFAIHVLAVGSYSKDSNPFLFSAYQFLICGLLSLIVSIFTAPSFISPVFEMWFEITYACIVSVLCGYTLQVIGQKRVSATTAAFIMSLEGPIALGLGALIIGESHTDLQNLGALIITIAAVSISLKDS